MGPTVRTISLETARRLAVSKQRLAGPLPRRVTSRSIVEVVRDLAYVQWDPVSIVAPAHILTLWNRLGDFRVSDLERLQWVDKRIFEHWTPFASLVLVEDYPIFASLMRRYPESLTASWGAQRVRARRFLAENADLRARILTELRAGPHTVAEFADHVRTRHDEGAWTPASDVAQMLSHLHLRGEVMVAGHRGNQNRWGRSDDFLPEVRRIDLLSDDEAERRAAERALRALGTATAREIHHYFVRGRYEHLSTTLEELVRDGLIERVNVHELGPREVRYIHARDAKNLGTLDSSGWRPRTSILSPFDNLIASTARAERIFGFRYVREQFLPPEKRRFGAYVLPVLHGDRFVGRVDLRLDRSRKSLVVNAMHSEPGTPAGHGAGPEIRSTLERLAQFLGATRVRYPARAPKGWLASSE